MKIKLSKMKKIFTILLLISAMISNAQSVSITSSASGAVCAGTAVTFTATPIGVTNPTYQWYKNSIAITGATSSTYSTTTLNNNDQIYVTCADIPNIVNDNSLQLWLDAGNTSSYTSGTTWTDLSGKNNHGTLMNGASFDAASKSIVTNGVDQYVSVPLFNSSITNTTMQTWVYINANSHGGFMANGTSSYSIGIGSNVSGEMNSNGNQAWMLFSSVRYINTNTSYSTGWHLVTMTMSASSVPSYYLDGSFVFTSSGSNPSTPSGSFNLGAVPSDGPKYYNGKFAAAYFYNRVLSSTEISQNYNASAARFGGSGSSSISSNSITSTVNPISSITIVGGAQNSQTVCNNTAISRISYNTTGATGANFSSLPANITGSWSNNVVSINGTPTVSGNYSYTVNLTGGCGTISATGSITVNASPTAILTVSGDACINKTTLSTTSGVYTYTWKKDNVTVSGATTNTYMPTAAGDFKVSVSNGTCSSTSTASTIYNCGVTADGKMRPTSSVTTLLSNEGGINFGTGTNETGSIFNTTGISTTTGTIKATSAIVGGVISATNAITSNIGVIYSTDVNFGTYSSTTIQSNVVAGTYTTSISGLASSTPYYAKSYIVNKSGTIYGETASFTTAVAYVPPTITTTGLVLNLDAAHPDSYGGSGTTWTDVSNNNNSVTLPTNIATSYSATTGGGSFTFNTNIGSNRFSSTSINNWNIRNTNAISIETWIKYTSTGGLQFYFEDAALNYRFGVDQLGHFYYDMGSHSDRNPNTATLTADTWHHVVITAGKDVSGSMISTFYIDGAQVYTADEGGINLPDISAPYYFGDNDPQNCPINAKVGVLRVYNKALSQSDITLNFNAQKSRFGL